MRKCFGCTSLLPFKPCPGKGCNKVFCSSCYPEYVETCTKCKASGCSECNPVFECDDKYCLKLDSGFPEKKDCYVHQCCARKARCSQRGCDLLVFKCCLPKHLCHVCHEQFCQDHLLDNPFDEMDPVMMCLDCTDREQKYIAVMVEGE